LIEVVVQLTLIPAGFAIRNMFIPACMQVLKKKIKIKLPVGA